MKNFLFYFLVVFWTTSFLNPQKGNATLEADSLELVNFYNVTDGPNWTPITWDLDQPIATWEGVTLNLEGTAVQVLVLNSNNLSGSMPDFDLPELTMLELVTNNLSGGIPDFSSLANLEIFSCGDNELSGSIPDFTNLPNLQEFNCSLNGLTGEIPNFTNLPNLKTLNINLNFLLGGSIPDFANLPSLEVLSLGRNNLSGSIPNFTNLPNLTFFRCGNNVLEGEIPNFTNLPNLDWFACYDNNLSGSIPDFSSVPLLELFDCYKNNLSGSVPDFSNLPNLGQFFCYSNNLTGEIPDFTNLPNLITFNCSDNNLSGCYPLGMCDINFVAINDNPGLPDGGSAESYENFCINPSSQFGLPCDDNNPNTINSIIQPDCSCSSTNPFTNFVEGKLFMDTMLNCVFDADEKPIEGWLITAVGNNETYYDVTDEQGNYKIFTDIGEYNLQVVLPNGYWNICPEVQDSLMTFTNPDDIIEIDIPLEVDFLCPIPSVDISTPFLRRCFDNNYTVYYCNEGTAMLEDGYIEVTFDDFLTVNSSTLPWIDQNEQTFTFDIGNLDINECGTFNVNVTVDCENTFLGQTHCVEAHIFPDSICLPPNSEWDGSTIQVEAICETDSLTFLIENVGDNDMASPSGFLIIEDNLILRTGTFILQAGESDAQSVEKSGATYRMEAGQSEFHPTNSTPGISVEGCANSSDPVSLGFVNMFPEDDADPFISIDCQQNIGAYDPNDKRGYPIGLDGIDNDHLISNGTELEYHIRFQNTGTDTAFTVIVRDTLSEFLDPSTIRMGAASHPYVWNILGTNTLEVSFRNIMLPDSIINEAASHGFFKFKIKQDTSNQSGAVINNDAAIYFDFNDPVITPNFYHIIEDNLILDPVEDLKDCDHWYYLSDTTIYVSTEFSYYELNMESDFTFIENEITFIDTSLTEGTLFMDSIYVDDTTFEVLYSDSDNCDSLVIYSIQIITDVSEIDVDNSISIYPNPAQSRAFIKLDLSESIEAAEIKIYTQLGQVFRMVYRDKFLQTGKHIISLDVDDFPPGMYYVDFHTNTFTLTKKMIVN